MDRLSFRLHLFPNSHFCPSDKLLTSKWSHHSRVCFQRPKTIYLAGKQQAEWPRCFTLYDWTWKADCPAPPKRMQGICYSTLSSALYSKTILYKSQKLLIQTFYEYPTSLLLRKRSNKRKQEAIIQAHTSQTPYRHFTTKSIKSMFFPFYRQGKGSWIHRLSDLLAMYILELEFKPTKRSLESPKLFLLYHTLHHKKKGREWIS